MVQQPQLGDLNISISGFAAAAPESKMNALLAIAISAVRNFLERTCRDAIYRPVVKRVRRVAMSCQPKCLDLFYSKKHLCYPHVNAELFLTIGGLNALCVGSRAVMRSLR